MKRKYTVSFLIVSICSLYHCFAQSDVSTSIASKLVPLSPNAAEFAKYGNIPVSPSTGTPNISIPLYEINTGKIKVPISISYHASGIQVNQKATWVGLGWSLNAGGIISRSVRGTADEQPGGWMNKQGTTQSIINSTDYNLLTNYAIDAEDSSPDFFNYGTPSISGRFIYSQTTSSFQTIPTEPIKIRRIVGSGYTDNTYQITDVDGTNYYYQDKQTYFNDADGNPSNHYTQSWYLSKIVSANTKDTVQFNYQTASTQGGTNEEQSEMETVTYTTTPQTDQYQPQVSKISQSYFYHSYMALKEIVFKQGKVAFFSNTPRRDYLGCMLDSMVVYNKTNNNTYAAIYKYQFDHDYFTTAQPSSDQFDYRLRLLAVRKVPVAASVPNEMHQFVYNSTLLPSINSQSVDYWGFYNGASAYNGYIPNILPGAPELYTYKAANTPVGGANRNESDDYIQAGILQKIIYPTKGSTVFNYEPHQYISDQEQTTTTAVASGSLTGAGRRVIKKTDINFNWPANTAANSTQFVVTLSPYTNPASLDDVPQRVTLTDVTTNTMMATWVHDGNMSTTNTFSTSFNFDVTHNYRVTLTVNDDAPVKVSFSLTTQITNQQQVSKKGGGLRIASIQNFDNTNALLSTEKYIYSTASIGKNDVAIANNYNKIMYRDWTPCGTALCGCSPHITKAIVYYGTSGYSGQNFEGANVLYGEVRKTMVDANNITNGQTIYTFDTGRAFSSIYNPSVPGGREFIDNSLGKTSLPTSEGNYARNSDGSFRLLKLRQMDYGVNTGTGFQEMLIRVYANYVELPNGGGCHNNYFEDFVRYDYSVVIGNSKLSNVTETDYSSPNSPVVTTTHYDYENPVHLQVTKVTTTGSDGKAIVVQNKYPADYTDNTYGSDLLRSQSINNQILEQTINKGNSFVSKIATSYRNAQGSIMPDYSMKALITGNLENRVRYNQYDADGNLLELSRLANNSEQKTSYIWGYSRQYPIAKIDNASYQDLVNVLGQGTIDQLAVSTPSDPVQLRNMLSPLRTDSRLKNALVTVYTYNPLVGVTSTTDPKGMTTTYEYDSFQRLVNVKDKDGNIVKHNDYHYQNQ